MKHNFLFLRKIAFFEQNIYFFIDSYHDINIYWYIYFGNPTKNAMV